MADKRIYQLNEFSAASIKTYEFELDKTGLTESEKVTGEKIINDTISEIFGDTVLLTDNIQVTENPANPNAPDIDINVNSNTGELRWMISGTVYTISTSIGLVLDERDSDPRFDLIYLGAQTIPNPQGVYVRKGTPSTNPVKPIVNIGEIEIAFVLIDTNISTNTNTNNYQVNQDAVSVYPLVNSEANVDVVLTVDNDIEFIYHINHAGESLERSQFSFSGNQITINVPWSTKTTEKFNIHYCWLTEDNDINPDLLLVTIESLTYSESNGNVTIEFDLVSTNPLDKYVNLNILLNVETKIISPLVMGNDTEHISLQFNDLPAATYTATITGDITDSLSGIVVPANAASYVFDLVSLTKVSNSSIKVIGSIQNTGTADGNDYLKADVDGGNKINIGPKPILMGATILFEYTFTDLTAALHTINLFQSDNTPIDSDTCDLSANLPIVVQRNIAGYVSNLNGVWVQNNLADLHHSPAVAFGSPNGMYISLNFLMIGVNAGFTAIKIVYPKYLTVQNQVKIYKFLHYPNFNLWNIALDAVIGNLIATKTITANGSYIEEELDLGATYVAWAAGKITLDFILEATSSNPNNHSFVAMANFKLKFEY
jgi:hypothetical protein